ncbi:hypothetical protein [Acinetobacter sp.]|uniref:hypothetical protein n=1 Tax=Acinetobacter sp. TaxID=472 RepID=UPI0035B300AA
MNQFKLTLVGAMTIVFVGCQSTPTNPPETLPKVKQDQKTSQKTQKDTSKVVVTPLPDDGIRRESQPLPSRQPPRLILPENQKNHQHLKDGQGVPAYQNLMQSYLGNLRQNKLKVAESSLLQAQRIAPQSAEVYRELARLANLRKQASSAEAFARKGLSFAQNNTMRKQLWEQILQSAKLRNNANLTRQATQMMQRY